MSYPGILESLEISHPRSKSEVFRSKSSPTSYIFPSTIQFGHSRSSLDVLVFYLLTFSCEISVCLAGFWGGSRLQGSRLDISHIGFLGKVDWEY